jgi:DNA-binding SARP family transcriptional activator
MDAQAISFGPFRLLTEQRLLLEGDRPVRLGSRAFDILAALVERPGEVLGKEQLIARAWPQTVVEDSNLKIQVSALRRASATDKAAIAMSSPCRAVAIISLPRCDARRHCAPLRRRPFPLRRRTICRSPQRA